jgi:predicted nuclease of predicted toxin-antitoxin system
LAKFYSDENFPHTAVEALRKLGHDVLTAFEAGQADKRIPDDEVLRYAIREERIVLTFNRKDFIKLHEKNSTHTGIVVCKVDVDFEALAERVDRAIKEYSSMQNQLIRVTRAQDRDGVMRTEENLAPFLQKSATEEAE